MNLTTIDQGHYAVAGYNALEVIEPFLRNAKRYMVPVSKVKQPAQFVEKECSECHRVFSTNNDSDKCYNCTLDEITHGMAPEEGDFNTAKILSGTMTAQERAWLQQDLEQVENGTSHFEPEELDERDEEDWEEDNRDDWEFDENQDAKYGHEG